MSNIVSLPLRRAVHIWPADVGSWVGISTAPADSRKPSPDAGYFADESVGFDHALDLGEKTRLPIVSLRGDF